MATERFRIHDSITNALVKDGRLEVDVGGAIEATITAVVNTVSVGNTVSANIVNRVDVTSTAPSVAPVYSALDQTKFIVNGAKTEYNVSACVSTAWNNVTTAKELSMYANQNIEYKLNATANGNMILPKKSSVFESNLDMDNVFVTTTQTTTCYIQLKGE